MDKLFCSNGAFVQYSSSAMENRYLAAKSYLCRFLIAQFSHCARLRNRDEIARLTSTLKHAF
jgi:hypothetical protein